MELSQLIEKINFETLSLGGGIAVLGLALVIGWIITTLIKAIVGK